MTEKIYGPDGEILSFDGPTVRCITSAGCYPLRYQIHDENGRGAGVFELSGGAMATTLADRGFKIAGRLVEDPRVVAEWGYSFGLERVERERGFPAEILTGLYHSPNGGLSSHAQCVTIVGDDLPDSLRISYVRSDAPAVRLTDRPQRCLVPADDATNGLIGPMASGAFVYSCDSRWKQLVGTDSPIPLHDRFETPEHYAALSS